MCLQMPMPVGALPGTDGGTEAWTDISKFAPDEIIAYSAISDDGQTITVAPSGRGAGGMLLRNGQQVLRSNATTLTVFL